MRRVSCYVLLFLSIQQQSNLRMAAYSCKTAAHTSSRIPSERIISVPRRFLATIGGRVDINRESGLAVYKRPHGAVGWTKLTPGLGLKDTLLHTGVTGSPQIRKGGVLMIITAISYFIIQASDGPSMDTPCLCTATQQLHVGEVVFLATPWRAASVRRRGGILHQYKSIPDEGRADRMLLPLYLICCSSAQERVCGTHAVQSPAFPHFTIDTFYR